MIQIEIVNSENANILLGNRNISSNELIEMSYYENEDMIEFSFIENIQFDNEFYNSRIADFLIFNHTIIEYYVSQMPLPTKINHILARDFDYELFLTLKNSIYTLRLNISHRTIDYQKWNLKWSPLAVLNHLSSELSINKKLVTTYYHDEEYYSLELEKHLNKDAILLEEIKDFDKLIEKAANKILISLRQIQWRVEFEKNEKLFTTELIIPLLRRMNFYSIHYNHGKKEYGKDITFSQLDDFGHFRHFSIQVKSGNINGKVRGDIDEIISQIEDSFSMPYFDLGIKNPRYISTLIIAISGFFTENAKEKIVNKIPRGLIGSVYFIDKEKILELIDKYWN